MVRDWRILLLPLIIVVAFITIFLIFQGRPKPEQKPAPPTDTVQPEEETSKIKPKWYVHFSVKGQKSTYYTEAAQAPASASAKGYFLGSGAVHPLYSLNAGGEARQPIIPFGSVLYLSEPVEILGNKYDSLVVNDTGDVNYRLWRQYPYWVDIYAGQTNYYTNKAAYKSGVKMIDYSWYQPWI
jgi:3D (Asp-Asp-Asp) domain-containing protein